LTQEASDAYCWDLRPGAWILVDKDLVTHPPSNRAVALPFTTTARDKLRKEMMANVIALAAISELTRVVSRRSLERSLSDRLPPGSTEAIKKALSVGTKLAKSYRSKETVPETEDVPADEL
jgi:2-oxoglutarate ferredoxin oxidoreductase subunit gamma